MVRNKLNCDNTQNLEPWQNSQTLVVTELKTKLPTYVTVVIVMTEVTVVTVVTEVTVVTKKLAFNK